MEVFIKLDVCIKRYQIDPRRINEYFYKTVNCQIELDFSSLHSEFCADYQGVNFQMLFRQDFIKNPNVTTNFAFV